MSARDEAIRRGLVGGGRELRSEYGTRPVLTESRAAGSGWTLSGHASVTGVETVIAGLFREVIEPGAFARVLTDDVVHLLNHSQDWVLARTSSGTLSLSEDSKGLAYSARLDPSDPQAQSVRAKVLRGDLTGASFAFTVSSEVWSDQDKELPLRRVRRVGRLFDTSSVVWGAYPSATTGARSAEEAAAFERSAMRRRHLRWARLLGT